MRLESPYKATPGGTNRDKGGMSVVGISGSAELVKGRTNPEVSPKSETRSTFGGLAGNCCAEIGHHGLLNPRSLEFDGT
jgi:hypothetical protein